MAESAFNLVIRNLVPLLAQEAKLLEGIHEEVNSIIREMDMIKSFLKDADIRAEKDHMDHVAKTWVKQVREEAYHIEDVIDEYIRHFAKQPHGQSQCFYFLHKVSHIVINLKARHVIASEIQGINRILGNIKKNGERYSSNVIEQRRSNSDAISDTWHDPRTESLLIEEAEVVGIESRREKLINWLVEGPTNCMVISTVGIGGLGKTTLVKQVYENVKVTTHFDCRAWITVSQSYKMKELLKNMIKELYEAKDLIPVEIDRMEQTTLMKQIRRYLNEHRYVVVFDDVWKKEFWDCIELALPKNKKGSRILITSRREDIVPYNYLYKLPILSSEEAWILFCKKVFQREEGHCPPRLVELSRAIVERCEGLPLAIVVIGGLLSTKDKVFDEWRKFHDSLSSELKSNSDLQNISKILSFSYHDLSYNLKACLLYFGMFPEDYYINCARLMRLWIAEGFVEEMQGITLEEVAQDYLNQLIHRSLVQVDADDFIGRTRSCRIHDIMLEVILSRSEELGFHLVAMQNYSFNKIARRLSIQNNVKTSLQSATSYQTRSILTLRVDEVPSSFLATCFANFKLMKVMDFEGAPINRIPKEVGNLFHLRYLSLRDTKVQNIPKSIGKLHNLETLDLKYSLVSELPVEISRLRKLRYLVAYNYNKETKYNIDTQRGIKIPNGIMHLECLQKLFYIEATSTTLITELGSLAQLRKLGISKLKKEDGTDLCAAIGKMYHLRSLDIKATSKEEVLNLQSLPVPPLHLQTLCLYGRLEKLPEWIPKLKNIVQIALNWSKLMEDPLKVLQALPNLVHLQFHDGYGGEQLHIEGGGFQKLKFLGLRNLGGLNKFIIDEGALPLLEKLVIGDCPQLKEVPSGIHHLKSLKNIEFDDMPTEFVLSLQPDEGLDVGKVKLIPCVEFRYRAQGEHYYGYDLGHSELLERLKH